MIRKSVTAVVVLVTIVAMVVTGCAAPASTPTPVPPTQAPPTAVPATPKPTFAKTTFGVVYDVDDADVKAGIADMAKSLGVDVLEASAGGDMNKVFAEMEAFVNKGVHGIIVTGGAQPEMGAVLSKAEAAKIPVVTIGTIPQARVSVTAEVIVDDYDLAFESLKLAFLSIGGRGKLGVYGAVGSKNYQLRDRVVRLMSDLYANVKTFGIGAATDTEAQASQKTYDSIQSNQDVGVYFATDGKFVAGIMDGIKRRNLTQAVPVYAAVSKLTPDLIKVMAAPESTWAHATYPDWSEAGRVAVRLLVTSLTGKVQRYAYIVANHLTQEDARKLGAGEMPKNPVSEWGWSQEVWDAYTKNDAAGVSAAKAAYEEVFNAALKTGEVKLPDPAQLPADFAVKDLVFGAVHQRTAYQHNELLRSGFDEITNMYNIKVFKSDANSDFAKMSSDMEAFIAQGVDAIFVDHGTTAAQEPQVRQAVAKGIKVVTFDNPQPNVDGVSCEVAQDDYGHAFMGLRQAISFIGGKGKLGVVWIGGSVPLENRVRVLRMILESYPDIIPIEYGERTANYPADVMAKTEAALGANPDIKAIWVTFDQMALGAHEALKQLNRMDIPIYSVDMSSEDIARMSEPNSPWVYTATSDPTEIGRVVALYMIAACYDQPMPRYVKIPAFGVNQEQARTLPQGTLPSPMPTGYGWTPFMVALLNKIQGR